MIPERRSAGLNPACVKAAAGAVEYMKVARVSNLCRAIEEIKERGVWVYAADMDGENVYEADLTGAGRHRHRRRGRGRFPAGAEELRQDAFNSHEGAYQFAERIGSGRHHAVSGLEGAKRLTAVRNKGAEERDVREIRKHDG